MPVFKFKTLEEAEMALWELEPTENYLRQVAELWNFANRLCPIDYPKGIFKFRSLEEANKHRDEIELKFARDLRARRNQESK